MGRVRYTAVTGQGSYGYSQSIDATAIDRGSWVCVEAYNRRTKHCGRTTTYRTTETLLPLLLGIDFCRLH